MKLDNMAKKNAEVILHTLTYMRMGYNHVHVDVVLGKRSNKTQ